MMRDRYIGKYPPPPYPVPQDAPAGMGVAPFALIPEGFQNGAVDAESVFYMLDDRDASRVRATRLAAWHDHADLVLDQLYHSLVSA